MSPEDFAKRTGVSRETLDRLRVYDALLLKWQRAINLIGPRTIEQRWTRHFLDSAQLLPLGRPGSWLDLGSGAGFPGLVLAIMGAGETHLVESDLRKALFLREVARETGAAVTVHQTRAEALLLPPVATITARALAPLVHLLPLAHRFAGPDTVCLFPKGQDVADELTEATRYWSMSLERLPSRTDPAGLILRISGLRHEPSA